MDKCTVKDICNIMNSIAPEEYAEGFDNVGLLVGDKNAEVTGILLALDATAESVDLAVQNGCNMIVTHHPLIFSPLKSVTTDDAVGSVVYKLIQNGIALYSAHTNFDKVPGGTDDMLAEAVGIISPARLEENELGFGRLGNIPPTTARELKDNLSPRLGASVITTADDNKPISTVATVAGSGGDFVELAIKNNVDLFITGEMNYHTALDAKRLGLDVMLCSHHASEQISLKSLKTSLQNRLNSVQYTVKVISSPISRFWS